MDSIYILRLYNDKWYIGRSGNVERRFEQHVNGDGAKWTFLHKPINIHETRDIITENDEDIVTREYMKQFGIYNVRGGKYCAVEFKPWHIREIKKDMENDKKKNDFIFNPETHFINEKFTINFMQVSNKISNELFNPDSDLRSGRWFRGLFGV